MISRRSEDQHRKLTEQRSSSVDTQTSEEDRHEQMKKTLEETHFCSEGDSDSSLPSPRREQLPFSDLEASAEESDPRPPPSTTAEVWVMKRHQQKVMFLYIYIYIFLTFLRCSFYIIFFLVSDRLCLVFTAGGSRKGALVWLRGVPGSPCSAPSD